MNPVIIKSATLINGCCMEFMATLPDNAFDLAIVDPPYGIGAAKMNMGSERNTDTFYDAKDWDTRPPPPEYFTELNRISERQVIWGGNYFTLPPSRGFVIWDKKIGHNDFAMCEYAWLSFSTSPKIFAMCGTHLTQGKRIHPTQKPVKLYEWLLTNYAKPGDKILDTHGGSMSSVIAAIKMGYDITCCELDADYYAAAVQRVQDAQRQGVLI